MEAIAALVLKGLIIAETVWENRDLALGVINAIKNLLGKDEPTAADIAATEAELDALLAEFNAPLPPE